MNSENLQRAIFAALTGNAALVAATKSISAYVVQPDDSGDPADFPYVTIGQDNITPEDTKDKNGGNAVCQIDVWSRERNYIEAKAIADLIYGVLQKGDLAITGANHIETRLVSAVPMDDPDGVTKRMMMLFRVVYFDN